MKRTLGAFIVAIVLTACSNKKSPIEEGQTAEEQEILIMMDAWGEALSSGDIDKTMTYYSENFSGTEAKDKEGMRALLNEAKSYGMLMFVDINLLTADLQLEGDTAEIIIYDDGVVDMDLALAKEANDWHSF